MTAPLGQVEQAFAAALALREAGGAAALTDAAIAELCGHDPRLRAEVASLLRHADEAGPEADRGGASRRFLDPLELHGTRAVAAALSRDALLQEWGGDAVGQRVGDFVIIGLLGAGGMGVVYSAEQQRPRRPVALKLIRQTYATPAMVARFEREAELLGRLNHPGIAQIYAAGLADVATRDGGTARVPYIAMEPVDGQPIADYARAAGCGWRDVLQLVAQACDAIQYAHQRGVVHRDLKPANLLVVESGERAGAGDGDGDGDGDDCGRGAIVKVLDFGVARSVEASPDGPAFAQLTGHGDFVGTPAYMSPEQVRGRGTPADARSDVYALGAILYELLAGRQPIDMTECSLHEAMARIVARDPTPLGVVDKRFRGDLETIVATTLAKDPARRYQTCAALGRDLSHVLAGDPIQARRDSIAYRMRKRAARHRTPALAACLLVTVASFALHACDQGRRRAAADRVAADARRRAEHSLAQLRDELGDSRIERARLLSIDGDLSAAEDLVWPEYLRRPDRPNARWALWELYCRPALPRATYASSGTDGKRASVIRALGVAGGGRIRLQTLAAGGEDVELVSGLTAVRSLQFTADGSRLLAAGVGGLVLLNVRTGRGSARFDGHRGAVNSACLSPDGLVVASTGDDGSVRLWDAAVGTPYLSLDADGAAGRCVRFDRAGARLAATFDDGRVMLWSIEWRDGTPALRESAKFSGHPASSGVAVAFSPDGAILAGSADDGVLRLWNGADGREIAAVARPDDSATPPPKRN